MSEPILPITDKNELKHLFYELQYFDLRLYVLSYIVLRTYENPQNLYSLKVSELAPLKKYTSAYGNTLVFTDDFRKVLFALAEGKDIDELIFKGTNAAGAMPTPQLFSKKFFDFKNKTGINVNFKILQRTFIYEYFTTTGKMPPYAPTRYHNPYHKYIQTHLNLTDAEYESIKCGNLRESIFTNAFPDSVYIPANKKLDVKKRIDTINRFSNKTIRETEKCLDACSPNELSLILPALEELELTVRKAKETCIALQKSNP